jgi:hypothetical protein
MTRKQVQTRQIVEGIDGNYSLGSHKFFELEPGRVYSAFCPFPENALKVRVQVSGEIWVRFDGGDPAENLGFSYGKRHGKGRNKEPMMEPLDIIVCGHDIRLITFEKGILFQAQWIGFANGEPVPVH